jgi:hypothetical protein
MDSKEKWKSLIIGLSDKINILAQVGVHIGTHT